MSASFNRRVVRLFEFQVTFGSDFAAKSSFPGLAAKFIDGCVVQVVTACGAWSWVRELNARDPYLDVVLDGPPGALRVSGW